MGAMSDIQIDLANALRELQNEMSDRWGPDQTISLMVEEIQPFYPELNYDQLKGFAHSVYWDAKVTL